MSRTISHDQVLLYQYAKRHRGHFAISKAAPILGIRENSAYRHALAFEELGIFESERLYPEQAFRLRPKAALAGIDMVRRLEKALPVATRERKRRQDRDQRADQTVSAWPAAGTTDPDFRRPNGRRGTDAGRRV